jgi:hypothetical protein
MSTPLPPTPMYASAATRSPDSERTNYDLIAALHTIRTNGDAAKTAIEEYDPDLAVRLSSCMTLEAAEVLLNTCLVKRIEALERTQATLRRVWTDAQAQSNEQSRS